MSWDLPTLTEFQRFFPYAPTYGNSSQPLFTLEINANVQETYFRNYVIENPGIIVDTLAQSTPDLFWSWFSANDSLSRKKIFPHLIFAFNLYATVMNKIIQAYARNNSVTIPSRFYRTDFVCPTLESSRWDDIYSGRSLLILNTGHIETLLLYKSNGGKALFWNTIRDITACQRSVRNLNSPKFLRDNPTVIIPATILVEPELEFQYERTVPANTCIYSRTNMSQRTGSVDNILNLTLGQEYARRSKKNKIPFTFSELASILDKSQVEIPENIQQDFFERIIPFLISTGE
jgi:hypothetical protein